MMKILLAGDSGIGTTIAHALARANPDHPQLVIMRIGENDNGFVREWTPHDDSWLKDCFAQMKPHMPLILKSMRERRKLLDEMMKYWTYEEETEKQATKRIIKSILKRRKRC